MVVEEIFLILLVGVILVLYDDWMGLDVEVFEGYLLCEWIIIVNLLIVYWYLWIYVLYGVGVVLLVFWLVIVGGEVLVFECL